MAEPVRVAIMCPGAQHITRGYERSLSDLHGLLTSLPDVHSTLVVGTGRREPGVRIAPVMRRDRPAAKLLSAVATNVGIGRMGARLARPIRDPYRLEQATFALSAIPVLRRLRPQVIVVSDVPAARALARLLRGRAWAPRIIFRNGAPLPPPYPFADLVQHLTPVTWRMAIDAGEPPDRHALLTTGFHLDALVEPTPPHERQRIRAELGLPTDRPIVLSVGALNVSHKRHDHLIREFGMVLEDPQLEARPYLVILGEEHPESPAVRALARGLSDDDHRIGGVAPAEIARWYRAADVFTLASVIEALPRALVEAAAAGLPPIVHDCERTRWVLHDHGRFVDMEAPGALATELRWLLGHPEPAERMEERRASVTGRFSWDQLGDQYRDLVERAVDGRS